MKAEKNNSIVELSSVYFYEDAAPKVLSLKDCKLPTNNPIAGTFSALYGSQSKQDGFMAARAYADKHRLEFTVVDFSMDLRQKQNALITDAEDIQHYDFMSVQRLSRGMTNELRAIFQEKLAQQGALTATMDTSNLAKLIVQRPDMMVSIMDEPGWKHLKVIAYPAKLTISDKPLSIATLHFHDWGLIKEASCRLNPGMRITLEPPGQQDQNRDHQKQGQRDSPGRLKMR
ncbi:MAG: hypothetical protein IT497_04750 [Ottowia sp.]|nr:hypothetical protein [Ottowia sp.]